MLFKTATLYLLATLLSTPASAFTPAVTSRRSVAFRRLSAPALHSTMATDRKYSMADQKARFQRAKDENNKRFLDITTVYDGAWIKGKRIAITGCNRGLGLAIAKEVVDKGGQLVAITRSTSDELDQLKPAEYFKDIDVTDDKACESLKDKIKGGKIDVLINNSGFFTDHVETLDDLQFDTEIKEIDICALGPLRVSSALVKGGHLGEGSKIITITSQGGSVEWRSVQNPDGKDYGHHMSKAAANMMMVLMKQELAKKKIAIGIFHPGFNKTGMTKKYEKAWEEEGAVPPETGAKRVLYEVGHLSMETSGHFINCEDGLEIPW